jgi:hypothetical protein
MSEIRVVELQETEFGEKAVIESPFESKDYIKHLPWKDYSEELKSHGSLKEKAKDRGTNVKSSDMKEVFDSMEDFGFSDDFSTHVSWDPEALNGDGAWTIDRSAVMEAAKFWEFAGFSVKVEPQL